MDIVSTRRSGQLNNKGFSLLELLIAIGISAVVTTMVAGILSTTTSFHKMTSQQAQSQTTNQEIAARLQNAIVEANEIYYKRPNAGGDFVLFLGNTYDGERASNEAPKGTLFYFSSSRQMLFERSNRTAAPDEFSLADLMDGATLEAPDLDLTKAAALVNLDISDASDLTIADGARAYLVGTGVRNITFRCPELGDANVAVPVPKAA